MSLVRKIPTKAKRSSRWRSQSHLAHVRKHACCVCDSEVNIEAAHLRLGTDGSMAAKPSDYFVTPLCGGPDGCHARQHKGERSFWQASGKDPLEIIEELIRTSPRRREILEARNAQKF